MHIRYVVDTNVLVHWLLKPYGLAAKLIRSLELELFTPYKAVDELWERRTLWSKKQPRVSLNDFIGAVDYYVKILYPPYDPHAIERSRQEMAAVDQEDVDFVTVALMKDAYVWSYDEDFKKQSLVRVVTSEDLLRRSHEILALYVALQDEYEKYFEKKRTRAGA